MNLWAGLFHAWMQKQPGWAHKYVHTVWSTCVCAPWRHVQNWQRANNSKHLVRNGAKWAFYNSLRHHHRVQRRRGNTLFLWLNHLTAPSPWYEVHELSTKVNTWVSTFWNGFLERGRTFLHTESLEYFISYEPPSVMAAQSSFCTLMADDLLGEVMSQFALPLNNNRRRGFGFQLLLMSDSRDPVNFQHQRSFIGSRTQGFNPRCIKIWFIGNNGRKLF